LSNIRYEGQLDISRWVGQYQNKHQFKKKSTYLCFQGKISKRKTCKNMDTPVPRNLCRRLKKKTYLLHDDDYDNDNNGGEGSENKFFVLVGI
jgi:hypothetical protein